MTQTNPAIRLREFSPAKTLLLQRRSATIFSLLCSFLLICILFYYSKLTNSLLLYNLGLVQACFTGVFLSLVIASRPEKQVEKIRLGLPIFVGFLFITLDAYWRLVIRA